MLPGCSICDTGAGTVPVGVADFNKSGNDFFQGQRMFAERGNDVPYYRCQGCGFMFTDFFRAWPAEQFVERIYNGEYLLADPPFADQRPRKMAKFVADVLGSDFRTCAFTDYGGGNGAFARQLHQHGFSHCRTYDPHQLAIVLARPMCPRW
jgi:hypothetical protein